MEPHQERVIKEEAELSDKLNKLGAFIHGEVFKTLPEEEQELLQAQDDTMREYLEILRSRIDRFKVKA